ncbi:MAG: hypothetical protein NXI04_16005 [Planctomycetaceae bacterium]|nr:hypothetical protein [Planctomycetaceae bacterium]
MMARRRLTFQLTPLLDLLLIVIFAQYMEVRQTAKTAQQQFDDQKTQLTEQFNQRRDELEAQYASQTGQLSATRERYSENYKSILKQHQQAGSALAQALNLPGAVMEQVLKLKTGGQGKDAAELQNAAQQLRKLMPSRGQELFRFMLRYDEMEKHVSIWELHLQDNGQAQFSDGERQRTVGFASVEEFVSRAFAASKAFAEPKPLVIILLSHGDTQAGLRRRATDGMPLLIEQLRRDAGNTRWFDYSLMGFRPGGAVFQPAGNPGVGGGSVGSAANAAVVPQTETAESGSGQASSVVPATPPSPQ